jgi:hypothetical protein
VHRALDHADKQEAGVGPSAEHGGHPTAIDPAQLRHRD